MNEVTEQHRRITAKLKVELGPELCALLGDPTVTDIMLNPKGKIWMGRLGKEDEEIGSMSASQAESLMGAVAASLDRESK